MYRNILLPIAMENGRDDAGALAVARALSAPDASVTLLHVMAEEPGYVVNYLPRNYRDDLRKGIEVELARMAEDLPRGTVSVIEGDPGRKIVEWAAENGIDCIVLPSHRPGMQDWFLGSTAARVVRHAACSVHVLR